MEKNLKIKKINFENDLKELKYFFENMVGSSINAFSYFSKRHFSAIKQHVVTNLVFDDDTPIAYSHLDKDKDNIWFGICVAENYIGKKIGNFLIQETLNQGQELGYSTIFLSVYKNNLRAINLYKKFNFIVYNENVASYFMKRTL